MLIFKDDFSGDYHCVKVMLPIDPGDPICVLRKINDQWLTDDMNEYAVLNAAELRQIAKKIDELNKS